MRIPTVLSLAVCGLLGAGPALAAGPSRIVHQPPTENAVGSAIPLWVRVEGVPDGEPTVTLHYRGASMKDFKSIVMASRGDSLYTAVVPGDQTEDLGVRYRIAVVGPENSYALELGSAATPFKVDLIAPVTPVEVSNTMTPVALSAAVALAGIGLFLRYRSRGKRNELLDQFFWYRTLNPFQSLTGDAAMARLQKLSQTTFDHPTRGRVNFSYGVLAKKLREIEAIDIREVIAELTALGVEPADLRLPVVELAPEPDPAAATMAAVAARQAAPPRPKSSTRRSTEVGATV